MAGIYTRDNLAQILNAGLENALRRQGERTKTENARIADNVKALNSFVKSVGYAEDDGLDDKLKKLQMEKAAAQKAQDEAFNQAMERSAEALKARRASLSAAQPMPMPVKDGFIPLHQSNEILVGNSGVPDYFSIMGNPVNWNYNPEEEARRSARHYGFGDFMGVYR